MNQALNAEVDDEPTSTSQASTSNAPSHSVTAFRSRTAKHLTILASFLNTLDLVFFVQLSTIYYLDSRLSTFLVRAITQLIILSPRVPSSFQAPASIDPTAQPLIGIIFSTNFICLLVHFFGSGPQAGEITQFYNYGGIFVDFVGEKTPISKLRIILLDLLVFGIQIVMLAGLIEQTRLSKLQASPTQASPSSDSAINQTGAQNLDAEERGIMALVDDPLLPDGAEGGLDPDSQNSSSSAHPLDPFTTGRFVVADTNLSVTIRTQWTIWKRGAAAAAAAATTTSENGSADTASGSNQATGTVESNNPLNGVTTLLAPFGFRVRFGGRVLGV